jgi:hypothetical protein
MSALTLVDHCFTLNVVINGIIRANADAFTAAVTGITVDIIFGKRSFFAGKTECQN